MKSTDNIVWINIIKAICMILVYINHSEIFYDCSSVAFGRWYRPIFVNAFFFISGYLLLRKQWSNKYLTLSPNEWYHYQGGKSLINNIIYKLIIPPTLIWGLVYIFKSIYSGEFDISHFIKITVLGESAWFTVALALSQLFILVMLSLRIKKLYIYIAVSLSLWCLSEVLRNNNFIVWGSSNVPWYYKSAMSAVIFLIMGGLFSKIEHSYNLLFKNKRSFITLLWIISYALVVSLFGKSMKTALDWQGLNIMGFVGSMIGIIALRHIVYYIPSNELINYIGRHTIGLYFLSAFMPKLLAPIFACYFPNSYVITLIVAIVSFILSLSIVWILVKYTPFVFDLRLLKK